MCVTEAVVCLALFAFVEEATDYRFTCGHRLPRAALKVVTLAVSEKYTFEVVLCKYTLGEFLQKLKGMVDLGLFLGSNLESSLI